MLARDLMRALDPVHLFRASGLEPDPWQKEILRSRARQLALLCSRQAGKSRVGATLAVDEAAHRPPALVLLLAPAERQSKEMFGSVKQLLKDLGCDAPAIARETELSLQTVAGSRIVCLPGKEKTIRGYSNVSLLVIDEAARVADDLYQSVRPMLAVSGGRLLLLSTPFGKRGFFHHEYTQGGPDWHRAKVTARAVPRIDPQWLEAERQRIGDWWFRQEYGCEFVETTDQVFSYDLVMRAISAEVSPLFAAEVAA